MSEEEKKAIEILHNWLCDEHSKFCRVGAVGIPNKEFFATEIVLNLVKNLIAGNKELKEENGRLREELENIEYIKRNFDYCLERKTKELEEDISEMYYKGVVLDILQDELNISRDEAIEILENY